ncbi:Glutamyl-Q tRNA(Asp) synthetase [Andreprevotia sp. IGB-42]|uniref:tRNA glutamyl-Q(34) synthetase GluQRS n=1 Tax=Andreprevotia sp. IGB-42 TaxID=2497473 RepID=UPI0013576331|nr:tRNA glutamyl-Q(34) synthetase GluQRS [Andreprevotia sp. IGB-42]KAF0815007.1 Glutamyl-Q tRNA(Asp) synthetase [Andreprevotia sp. IGB-42]
MLAPFPSLNLPDPPVIAGYCGRFAPSPTGELHLGSLLAAVASFLEARRHDGQWLVRMEDLDQPRMVAGAADRILAVLDAHGFAWDEPVLYQSARSDVYEMALAQLRERQLVYPCACTRREVAQIARAGIDGPVYPGTCRNGLQPGRTPRAWRLRVNGANVSFIDAIQGPQSQQLADSVGDFVLHRADGLFAYQLAVVVDDAVQNINHVVRGADLLDSTPRQIYLLQSLGLTVPHYAHIPVLVNAAGEKLSKQTLAKPLQATDAVSNLWQALDYLGQKPPVDLAKTTLAEIWQWAHIHWCVEQVPGMRGVPIAGSRQA